jgi:hypothetical protein
MRVTTPAADAARSRQRRRQIQQSHPHTTRNGQGRPDRARRKRLHTSQPRPTYQRQSRDRLVLLPMRDPLRHPRRLPCDRPRRQTLARPITRTLRHRRLHRRHRQPKQHRKHKQRRHPGPKLPHARPRAKRISASEVQCRESVISAVHRERGQHGVNQQYRPTRLQTQDRSRRSAHHRHPAQAPIISQAHASASHFCGTRANPRR